MRNLYRSYKQIFTTNQSRLFYSINRFNSSVSVEVPKEKIVIPNRINRGPTDILHALSATVGYDPTAVHYKYHDDPHLIPTSSTSKRNFALAQESGRKAALWIRQEHSKLFQHKNAEPFIDAYLPKMVYNEDSEVTESTLEQLIASVNVSDAIFVYNLMTKKNINISNELRQSFLELICFYNHEDTISEEMTEERWYSRSSMDKERLRNTWKSSDLAENIFNQIEPKDSKAYCCIIRGMCKYHQAQRGHELYEEALDKNVELDVETFNAVISIGDFLGEGEMCWMRAQELLQAMASRNIKPNLQTLNSCLYIISTINSAKTREFSLQTLAEFHALGIVPSLESWYYILKIFCRQRAPVSHVLVDILNQIEGKELTIQGIKDTNFFVTAMEICNHHLHDVNLAHRVNSLLHLGNNYDLIGDSYKESVYYRNYFNVACNNEPLDVFMQLYDKLVPNVYTPEESVTVTILRQIDTNGALELIPRMWSDIVLLDHVHRERVVGEILRIMSNNVPSPDLPKQVGLNERFGDIAWQIWTQMEEKRRDKMKAEVWTGDAISKVLLLICRTENYEKALEVFTKIDTKQHEIVGSTDPAALEAFVKLCISNKAPTNAITALQYCVENSFPNNEAIGQLIVDSLTLDEHDRTKILSLIGKGVFKKQDE